MQYIYVYIYINLGGGGVGFEYLSQMVPLAPVLTRDQQGQPQNVPSSFKQRAMLIDEIWHAAGDQASDIDWYIKRAVLGGIYSASEIFMLTDNSPGSSFSL